MSPAPLSLRPFSAQAGVFGIPGVGQLFTDSIVNRDYPLIMGITVFFAVLLVLAVLIVDLVYVLIDPRIKLD